jgi:hypothetical protein
MVAAKRKNPDMASIGWIIDKCGLEGGGLDLIETLSGNMPVGTEKNHQNPWDSLCHGRDSN